MGTFKKGILGGFSGKVGTVVGANWRGKDVMRSLPKASNTAPTEAQIQQRTKFAMTIKFLTPLQPIVTRYFGSDAGVKTRRNLAMAYLITEAIEPLGDDFVWNYSKILISRGDLIGLNNPTVTSNANQTLTFNWTDNSGQGDAKNQDKVLVVAYDPASKTTVFSLQIATRVNATGSFILPQYLSGATVHIWIATAAADDKLYSTSQYLGTAEVS